MGRPASGPVFPLTSGGALAVGRSRSFAIDQTSNWLAETIDGAPNRLSRLRPTASIAVRLKGL